MGVPGGGPWRAENFRDAGPVSDVLASKWGKREEEMKLMLAR